MQEKYKNFLWEGREKKRGEEEGKFRSKRGEGVSIYTPRVFFWWCQERQANQRCSCCVRGRITQTLSEPLGGRGQRTGKLPGPGAATFFRAKSKKFYHPPSAAGHPPISNFNYNHHANIKLLIMMMTMTDDDDQAVRYEIRSSVYSC